MMKRFLIVAGCVAGMFPFVYSQDLPKDSIVYEQGIPITENDTLTESTHNLPTNVALERIPNSKIPSKLRKRLEGDEVYKGWENSTIYLNPKTKTYLVSIRSDSTIRTFGFDKAGHPVTYDESSEKEE